MSFRVSMLNLASWVSIFAFSIRSSKTSAFSLKSFAWLSSLLCRRDNQKTLYLTTDKSIGAEERAWTGAGGATEREDGKRGEPARTGEGGRAKRRGSSEKAIPNAESIVLVLVLVLLEVEVAYLAPKRRCREGSARRGPSRKGRVMEEAQDEREAQRKRYRMPSLSISYRFS